MGATAREALVSEVLIVLADARFAAVFAPGSQAEIDIAAEMATGDGDASLSGRIDRLAVTDHEVLIVDYKTNRPAPPSLDKVPEAYVVQLALYARVLGRLYPERQIRTALLWTDIPALMPIPEERLEAAARRALGSSDNGGTPPIRLGLTLTRRLPTFRRHQSRFPPCQLKLPTVRSSRTC